MILIATVFMVRLSYLDNALGGDCWLAGGVIAHPLYTSPKDPLPGGDGQFATMRSGTLMRTDPVLFHIKLLRVLIATILVLSHEANLLTVIFPLLTIIIDRTCSTRSVQVILVYYTVDVGWYLVIKARGVRV